MTSYYLSLFQNIALLPLPLPPGPIWCCWDTNDRVLIPEGLPIQEIIPPLFLPSPRHSIVLRLDGVIGGISGMKGCCRLDGVIHKCTGSARLSAPFAVFFLFFFFYISVNVYEFCVISSHQADVGSLFDRLQSDN